MHSETGETFKIHKMNGLSSCTTQSVVHDEMTSPQGLRRNEIDHTGGDTKDEVEDAS